MERPQVKIGSRKNGEDALNVVKTGYEAAINRTNKSWASNFTRILCTNVEGNKERRELLISLYKNSTLFITPDDNPMARELIKFGLLENSIGDEGVMFTPIGAKVAERLAKMELARRE